jgi:FtsZ-binding cell division protein ZapB
MIEVVMYMAIGFLIGGLVALAAIPLVHSRAVRLTKKRLEAALPQSIAEIQADEDLLRAEFAMSTHRLQLEVEKLRDQNAKLLVQVGKKSDIANRLMAERDAMKAEIKDLRTQLAALDRQVSTGDQRRRAQARVVRQMIPRRLVS